MASAKIKAMLKGSGADPDMYERMSFDTFAGDTPEAIAMKRVAKEFAEDDGDAWLGVFGKSGTGKTHICIAACLEITKRKGIPHVYFPYRDEIQNLKAVMYKDGQYADKILRLVQAPLLFVDDFLKFAQRRGEMQDQDLQVMYSVLNARYLNRRKTVISSEYGLEEIMEIDEALGSRIYERCGRYILKCTGDNRRINADKEAVREIRKI
jgi:DNA replication protein DnaC